MDSALEYSFSGINMEFAILLTLDNHPIPEPLFMDIVVEKCLLLQCYLKSTMDCIAMVTNVNNGQATIQFIDHDMMKNPLLPFMITKEKDLEEQFYILWLRAQRILKMYHSFSVADELDFIHNFYQSEEYTEMICASQSITH